MRDSPQKLTDIKPGMPPSSTKFIVYHQVDKRCSEAQSGLLLNRALMKNFEGRCRNDIPKKLIRFGSHQFKVPSLKPFDLFLTCSDRVFVSCYAVLIWIGVFGSCIIPQTMVCLNMGPLWPAQSPETFNRVRSNISKSVGMLGRRINLR